MTGASGRRLAALTVILGVAAAARAPTLRLRRVVEGDGVHYSALARDVLAGDLSGLGNPYWSNLWPGAIALTRAVTRVDVVSAGRWASLVSGVLLAGATALLAECLFDGLAAWAAGLAVAAHPWLVHFSTLVFTESFFALLLTLLVWAAWRAAQIPSPGRALLLGLIAALAVVTRPEAFGVLGLALALRLAVGWRTRTWRAAARDLGLVLAVVALLVTARVALCRYYYDVWDLGIGSKGAANFIIGMAEDDAAKERITSEVTPEGENRLDAELRHASLLRLALAHPRLVLRHTARNLWALAQAAARVFPPVPVSAGAGGLDPRWQPLLRVIAAASLAAALAGLVAGRAGAWLAAVLALYLLGLAPLNVHDRLVVALVPLVMAALGHGVARGLVVLRCPPGLAAAAIGLGGVALAAVSAQAVLHAPSLPYGDDPPVQLDAARWVAAHFGSDTRLMTPCPAIAFYLFDPGYEPSRKYDEVDLPWLAAPELVAFAVKQEVQVLAAPEWYLTSARHPAAAALLAPETPAAGLRPLATVGAAPYRVHLYAVLGTHDGDRP
jgi:hypothetical protein